MENEQVMIQLNENMGNKKRKMKPLSEIVETRDRLRHVQIGQQEAQEADGPPSYIRITRNEFLDRKNKKLDEEDIAICECKYDANNPESACGESCLNVLTSTECTPGYCPCGEHCKNQKFQNREYAKTKLFKTEGRGWGLLADEHIKAGRFIIEYCGEVISSEQAQRRQQTYEDEGCTDAYIISLDASYFIDATKKGSLARFINHSCEPNCETRKWTVLGVTRVGIFAKEDISVGAELAYDYNFEWYGGATVRCLCGAAKCSVYLGAKSQGFQEYNHLWEEGDDRYTVENVPLYDSAEDDPFPVPSSCTAIPLSYETTANHLGGIKLEAATTTESHVMYGVQGDAAESVETERKSETEFSLHTQAAAFPQTTNPMISRIRSNSASHSYNFGAGPSSKKRPANGQKQKTKAHGKKYVSSKPVAQLFASKQAREEITKNEDLKNKATSNLNAVYDEIRPAIEAHERDSQDNVPTSIASKWMAATCDKWKADFNFSFSIINNVMFPPRTDDNSEAKGSQGGDEKEKETGELSNSLKL